MSREVTRHTNMRLPVDLLDWIDQRADQNGVTRTTQVARMLEFSKKAVIDSEGKR
jgi:hypothetical protein